jgi:hypothetical protein
MSLYTQLIVLSIIDAISSHSLLKSKHVASKVNGDTALEVDNRIGHVYRRLYIIGSPGLSASFVSGVSAYFAAVVFRMATYAETLGYSQPKITVYVKLFSYFRHQLKELHRRPTILHIFIKCFK